VTPARLRILGVLGALVLLVGGLLLLTRDDGGDDDASGLATSDDSTSTTDPTTAGDAPTASTTTSAAPATTGSTAPPSTAAPVTTGTATPPPSDPFATARIRLTPVASIDYPTAMAVRPSDGSLWIARKGGAVCRLANGSCTSSQVVASVSSGTEQGLLGITFNPSGSRFYASYTNPDGDSRVDEFPVRPDGRADLAKRRNIFAVDQPQANHNGGNVVFGPDGRLYLGLGDGGGAGDQHGTTGNAQNPNTDLGKILRIDPAGPTVQRWISGVRNPWRFNFDRADGSLWIGDVGQDRWEEVDHLRPGAQEG
jgi:glucose/arabinose dehydrogenase